MLQYPGYQNRGKAPRHSPRELAYLKAVFDRDLGTGEEEGGGRVQPLPYGPTPTSRHPSSCTSPPAPLPRGVLTALVSYRTSFWTELIMGAAAEGIAAANVGPTTGHEPPDRPRRLGEKTPQTLDIKSSQEQHRLGTKPIDDQVFPDSCAPLPSKLRPSRQELGWRTYHREVG